MSRKHLPGYRIPTDPVTVYTNGDVNAPQTAMSARVAVIIKTVCSMLEEMYLYAEFVYSWDDPLSRRVMYTLHWSQQDGSKVGSVHFLCHDELKYKTDSALIAEVIARLTRPRSADAPHPTHDPCTGEAYPVFKMETDDANEATQ